MRVAFVGKGGSGKTTLSSLFCRHAIENRREILAIDADINQHLAGAIGLEGTEEIPPLGKDSLPLKTHLRGTNERIATVQQMTKTTPPGTGSNLVRITPEDPMIQRYCLSQSPLYFARVGAPDDVETGIACYHKLTGAAELLLSHLIDRDDQLVVVDMTAGADAFSSGIFTKFDLTIVVVEPTLRSIAVFEQYCERAAEYGIRIKAIGNKITNEEDRAFLQERLGERLIGCLSFSSFVRSQEKGISLPFAELEPENRQLLERLMQELDACERDWDMLYRQTVEFHEKNAHSWANDAYGTDLLQQIDPKFRLSETTAC